MNSKIIPKFTLSHSIHRLFFTTVIKPDPLDPNLIFFDKPLIHIGIINYLDLVAFSIQEKNVSAITELIHHNQPVSISSSADLLKRADIHEYPVSRSSG